MEAWEGWGCSRPARSGVVRDRQVQYGTKCDTLLQGGVGCMSRPTMH